MNENRDDTNCGCALVVWGTTTGHTQSDLTVEVAGGRIRGALIEGNGAVFKAIPYAQPPVGDLRLAGTDAAGAWAEARRDAF